MVDGVGGAPDIFYTQILDELVVTQRSITIESRNFKPAPDQPNAACDQRQFDIFPVLFMQYSTNPTSVVVRSQQTQIVLAALM
jgi:hypothetical protein